MAAAHSSPNQPTANIPGSSGGDLPSWVVGVCGVAAVASLLFTVLLFLNR
jgi:hypothetical protein